MSDTPASELVRVGALKGAHGLKGEVRVLSFTANPPDIFTYGALQSEDAKLIITPKSWRAAKDHFILLPKDFQQKEYWDALKGTALYVPRARLPKPAADEFYLHDLIGVTVIDETGADIGRVMAVQNYGAGDLVEIRLETGGEVILVPFTDADVVEVDLVARRLHLADLRLWREVDDGAPPSP